MTNTNGLTPDQAKRIHELDHKDAHYGLSQVERTERSRLYKQTDEYKKNQRHRQLAQDYWGGKMSFTQKCEDRLP